MIRRLWLWVTNGPRDPVYQPREPEWDETADWTERGYWDGR